MPKPELDNYFETKILTMYRNADAEHNQHHIERVVEKCCEYALRCNAEAHRFVIDHHMILAAAYFHDISLTINHVREGHEIKSAQIFMQDEMMQKHFTPEQMMIIKEAIEDHKPSTGRGPRNIYGKILSQANTDFNLQNYIYRCYLSRRDTEPTLDFSRMSLDIYYHVIKKYNPINGYAYSNVWFEDKDIEDTKRLMATINTADKFEAFLKETINQPPVSNTEPKKTITTQPTTTYDSFDTIKFLQEHTNRMIQKQQEQSTQSQPDLTATTTTGTTEWDELYGIAVSNLRHVDVSDYVSIGFVSTAIKSKSGRIYKGVCVDTCCGLGICAERNALTTMLAENDFEPDMIVTVGEDKNICPPCGACRELIAQIKPDKTTKIATSKDATGAFTAKTLNELLPDSWL